ncbi:MAG TPA: hypothetical protein PLD47_10220 [Aggregatilineales bacterium]|nr:hypothetical protein [Anaerolineales bacterium]HRE48089.1 hypothetical protein [Aggregatilineales bacterium]
MKKFLVLIVITMLLLAGIAMPSGAATAAAYVSSYEITCNSFWAKGTATSPFVSLSTYSTYTDEEHFIILPVVDGKFEAAFTFPELPAGTVVEFFVWGTLNLYTNTGDPGFWDGQSFFSSYVFCTPGDGGRSVPKGFQLRTITCDVAVFNEPGGSPVANGAAIRGGQTWFVNPTPKTAADGSSWTEIFVSGVLNGYIPTACVG